MEKYQRFSLIVFTVFAVAWLLQDHLLLLVFGALAIYVALFTATWKLVFTGTQALGMAASSVGHSLIGRLGDTVADGSRNIKRHLSDPAPVQMTSERELGPEDVDLSDFSSDTLVESKDDLDVPVFIQRVMDNQNP